MSTKIITFILLWFFGIYTFVFALEKNNSLLHQGVRNRSIPSSTNNNISYPIWTILASYVDPRSKDFSGFSAGTCTVYIAQKIPELFLYPNWSRRLHGNAADRLHNAKKLWIPISSEPKIWSVAVFAPNIGASQYGHVALVEYIQPNGTIIISEMNFSQQYVVSYRVIDPKQVQWYLYHEI